MFYTIGHRINDKWDWIIWDTRPLKYDIESLEKYTPISQISTSNISSLYSDPIYDPDAKTDLRHEAGNELEKRARSRKQKIKTWKDVPENCILSQHEGYPLTDPCVYYTTAEQGKGVTVYIVDHLFAIHHKDFKHVSWGRTKDHIFTDEEDRLPRKWPFASKNPHMLPAGVDLKYLRLLRGTAVLSKLLGSKFGVARGVKPILVKTSNRLSNPEPATDIIFDVLPKVIIDIKKKSLKFDVSKREAPKFIILMAVDYTFDRGSGRAFRPYVGRFSQLIQELSEMPNVAVVCSDDTDYTIVPTPNPGEFTAVEPITSYPAIFGQENVTYPNLIVAGGTHPQDGGLMSPYSDFVRVSAPSAGIHVAVPDGGNSWGGDKYIKANSNPLGESKIGESSNFAGLESRPIMHNTSNIDTMPISTLLMAILIATAAAAIAGVLATLISARDYTMSEAIARVYKQAYPRRRDTTPKNDNRVFPNVIYNDLSLLAEEQKNKDEVPAGSATVTVTVYRRMMRCAILRRDLGVKAITTDGVVTLTVTSCDDGSMPETTSMATNTVVLPVPVSEIAQSPSEHTGTPVYDAAFCQRCIDADGATPIDNVLWMPRDARVKKGTLNN
ncbi:hypothetical protein TWF481_009169 [Arthrobotrys musiformis]|uniref:Uncharacterized protein n=1 Tax=Arthrobotrys musiformis TaxID=47236 RepID=A0AAV9W549_9PEZI